MYAVDLSNNFLVIGSESFEVLTAKMRITGLPILKRIIGIALRPSNGKLYGVGNDSRVYTIDPLTAEATPVSGTQFSPKIIDVFDIHFAMDLEPNGDRVRLIAAESGANWSISLDDGTAMTGETARYGPGIELEGQTPRLLGMYYSPPPAGSVDVCQNLAYGIDADEAIMIASCDPATGLWWPTVNGEAEQGSRVSRSVASHSQASLTGAPQAFEELKDQLLRCGEALPSPGVDPNDPDAPREPDPKDNWPWFPRTPPTPTYLFLVRVGQNGNSLALAEAAGLTLGVTVRGDVPSSEPIQSVEWVSPKYVPHPTPQQLRHRLRQQAQLSGLGGQEPEQSDPPAPPSDPQARCTNG